MATTLTLRRLLPLIGVGKRTLSISCCRHAHKVNVAFKQSRIMKKLITGSSHSRKKLYTVDQAPSKALTEFGLLSGKTVGTPKKSNKSMRRVEVLNTIFMEQITGLMSTGEVSTELLGKGITVSEVKVSRDFSKVNVYWVASGTETDAVIEPLLSKAGGKLRHELSQLRVIGIVPPIEFVKDKTFSKIIEVQTLLDKCDFGDDFVPTSPRNYFASSSPSSKLLQSPLDLSNVNKKPKKWKTSEVIEEQIEPAVDEIPLTETALYNGAVMRQDILGLRHDVIMTEVKQMMSKIVAKKTQTLSREEKEGTVRDCLPENLEIDASSIQDSTTATVGSPVVQLEFDKKRKDEFLKYLRNQQISRAKELKRESSSAKEKEFYDDEAVQRWKTFIEMEDSLEEKLDDRNDDLHEDIEEQYYPRNDNV